MKHVSMLVTMALVSFFPLAAANAASVSLGVGANVGASVGLTGGGFSNQTSASGSGSANANAVAGGNGSEASSINANTVLTAFESTTAAATAIGNLQSNSVVRVIPIAAMITANPSVFANVAAQNAEATAALQAAIQANTDFAAQLAGSGISVDNVVAGNVNVDGSMVLYTKG